MKTQLLYLKGRKYFLLCTLLAIALFFLPFVVFCFYPELRCFVDQNCDVVNRILVGNKNDDPDRKVSQHFLFTCNFFLSAFTPVPLLNPKLDPDPDFDSFCIRLLVGGYVVRV